MWGLQRVHPRHAESHQATRHTCHRSCDSAFQLPIASRRTTGAVTVHTTAAIQRPHEVTIVCRNSSQDEAGCAEIPRALGMTHIATEILRSAQDFRMKRVVATSLARLGMTWPQMGGSMLTVSLYLENFCT